MSTGHFFRFHLPHVHLNSPFGDGWFGKQAESFARFFGTPKFIVIQTAVVAAWIVVNALGWVTFDVYPFIFLNLAFSLQAAYAAPLILLAQTRQADRDKAGAMADAQHREELAATNSTEMKLLIDLMKQNTDLTNTVKTLTEKVAELTAEVHDKLTSVKE